MPQTDAHRVKHILDAIAKVQTRVAGLDESAFVANEVLHDSVLYIPWTQIVAFRNRIMHEYHSVSLRIVWQTIAQDLPALRSAMEQELALSRSQFRD